MYRFGDECGMCCSMTAGAVRCNTSISTFIEMCVGRFIKEFKSKRSLESELSFFLWKAMGLLSVLEVHHYVHYLY